MPPSRRTRRCTTSSARSTLLASLLGVATLHTGCGAATGLAVLGDAPDGGGGATADSSASGSSSGGVQPAPPDGIIELDQYFPTCRTSPADFSAVFGAATANRGCVRATADACTLYGCRSSPGSTGDDAGTIVVSGSGGTFAGPATLMHLDNGTYGSDSASYCLSAGQTLTVTGSGATVPAFGPRSVAMPAPPILTAPADPVTIPSGQDLAVAWAGGQGGATFRFTAFSGSTFFVCAWDSTLGRGTVPRSIVAGLPRSSSAGASVSFGQYATIAFTTGAYAIELDALAYSVKSATVQ